ncbi:flagellar basal body rod protein FlgF [Alteraurantiacibacter aquimixticola]|uniref:Flagellar basal-body rod protein FlgF n=1 Tax=Alteraurantiacibacter aquimixticola TaxID=2489173 RepID=A0A4T3F2N0_9SPHN|nr:flagellar basal body rod protein FlgF [Alteraurantiacibacter aquimixticola]TIX51515.1 flagellar hook-basal body complex protein [Alteraurantiacibacter aquimixticola]
MDRMIYTALSGMDAAMTRQRAIASNLANAGTTGFRAETFSTASLHMRGESFDVRGLAQGAVRGADMTPGSINQTGRNLDIAVNGEALIALQAPDGSEVYSRRGDLLPDAAGRLVNGEGLPVMGEAGPLVAPPGWNLSIASDGGVYAADPGAPDVPADLVGRIKLASPAGSPLLKGLDGLLRVPGGGILPADPETQVVTGALEQSNVDTAGTLVDMIDAQRSFERRVKLISTADQLDQASSRLMSLS